MGLFLDLLKSILLTEDEERRREAIAEEQCWKRINDEYGDRSIGVDKRGRRSFSEREWERKHPD